MAGVLQHLRSSALNKRPNPASMVDGQVAINYASGSPGMFFKDSNGSLVKVGPVHVGSSAPNAVPASGGTAGNSLGEQWLDTSGGTYVFKIWDGAAWRSEAGEFVNTTGDTMTGALGITAGSASTPGLFFSGDANSGLYSPGADQVAITASGTQRVNFGTGEVVFNETGENYDFRIEGDTEPNLVFVDASTNRVGLGTNSPSANLESQGNVSSTTLFSGFQGLRIQNANGSAFGVSADINFAAGTGSDNRGAAIGAIYDSATSGNHLYFATNGSSVTSNDTLTERLRITAAGRVGIGTDTSTPGGTLEVKAATSVAPFVASGPSSEYARIDSSGRLLVGTVLSIGFGEQIQAHNTSGDNIAVGRFSANAGAPDIRLYKSRGSAGINSPVEANDVLGAIDFRGADGSSYIQAASIRAVVDGTPGTNSMPGRIVLSTTLSSESAPTEAFRITNDRVRCYNQATAVAVNTTATLTVANLKTGIIISSTAAAVTMTLPTGTDTEAGFSGVYTNMTFEWSVINTGATNAVTVAAGTAHTIIGSGTVAAGASGRFASRRTASNTFVTYRLS